ncbi:rRNA (guanine-N1)-methyltransferase [Halomonas saccharevitans]|uniref:rRNA (Guanine-N1)-methyltransferase n=1 Tax=Halomonas saccharevitans TaxID=416872 RepID=A0ABU3NG27_9GAMM|nr:rRNA (guanine-N1)-methyltransferase [Halomonas saccharevitans]MDT8880116.1 rRNA (guanine-N1)-methyltransferase [Halomonas saccharevitans]
MSSTPFEALACPLDGEALERRDGAWRCAAGHSFDIARQGYVHLLPVQQKRSRDPGDSKAMIAARQRFLEAGYYRPVADAVSRAVLDGAEPGTLNCLDAGCGEGYYLRELTRAYEERCRERRDEGLEGASDAATDEAPPLGLLGLDISKWAVLAAARQGKQAGMPASWVVGSNAHLPVQTGTLDRLLCLFGFPVAAEFARVMKPGGVLLLAEAGPDHLRELREIIYPQLKPERTERPPAPQGFTGLDTETVRYSLALEGPAPIADLLAMTPHLYRASVEGRERAAALETLTVTVEVRLTRFVRAASEAPGASPDAADATPYASPEQAPDPGEPAP